MFFVKPSGRAESSILRDLVNFSEILISEKSREINTLVLISMKFRIQEISLEIS